MSLELFQKVPAGAIEALFDGQRQPRFRGADLGGYLSAARGISGGRRKSGETGQGGEV